MKFIGKTIQKTKCLVHLMKKWTKFITFFLQTNHRGTPEGEKFKELAARGDLVPDNLVV